MTPTFGIFNSNYLTCTNTPSYLTYYGSSVPNSLANQSFPFINTIFCNTSSMTNNFFPFFQWPNFNFQWPKINFPKIDLPKTFKTIEPDTGKGFKALKSKYSPLIEKVSKKLGADAKFISSVIKQESNFIATAVSRCKAAGLMQIMPDNWRGLGITNPFDPEQNIRGGTKMIMGLLKSYHGNKELALAAYNCGEGRVNNLMKKYGNSFEAIYAHLPKETRDYVPKIMNNYQNCA